MTILYNNMPKLAAVARMRAEVVTRDTARKIQSDAKARAPVASGFLRDSIEVTAEGDGWMVSVGADYGEYVEFGTRFTPAQPFFVPAVEANKSSFITGLNRLFG